MNIIRLKAKNQLTLPVQIIKKLSLQKNEMFQVDVEDNYIKLIPVDVKPKYTKEEMAKINKIVKTGKGSAKSVKVGSDFSNYIDNI